MHRPRTVDQPAELLPFLFAAWPSVKKKQVRTWLKYEAVVVNGRVITQFNHPLKAGDVVAIRTDRFATPGTVVGDGLKVHYEDASIIVIEKPPDLLTMASESEQEKTVYYQLTEYLREGDSRSRDHAWIVHRLDRETSGIMVFAKKVELKTILQNRWDKAIKRYQAVAEGLLSSDQGVFRSWLDESHPIKVYTVPQSPAARHAVTHYRVLKRSKGRTLVELTLETGRRHQIRVHLAEAGHPLVGDAKYGAKTDPVKRLGLHAWSLTFLHPVTNEEMRFEAPLPAELARLV